MRQAVFLRIVADNIVAVIFMMVVGVSVGLMYSVLQPDAYAATSRMMVVADPTPGRFDVLPATWVASARVRDYTSMINSQNLIERAIQVHDLDTGASLLSRNLTVSSPRRTQLLDITVTLRDPVLAADASTAIAQEFALALRELETGVVIHASVVHLADRPQRARDPRVKANVILTSAAMGLITLATVLVRAMGNPKVRWLGLEHTGKIAGAPVVGIVELHVPRRAKAGRTAWAVARCDLPPLPPPTGRRSRRDVQRVDVHVRSKADPESVVEALRSSIGGDVTVTLVGDGSMMGEWVDQAVRAAPDHLIVVIDEETRMNEAARDMQRVVAENDASVVAVVLRQVRGRGDAIESVPDPLGTSGLSTGSGIAR